MPGEKNTPQMLIYLILDLLWSSLFRLPVLSVCIYIIEIWFWSFKFYDLSNKNFMYGAVPNPQCKIPMERFLVGIGSVWKFSSEARNIDELKREKIIKLQFFLNWIFNRVQYIILLALIKGNSLKE